MKSFLKSAAVGICTGLLFVSAIVVAEADAKPKVLTDSQIVRLIIKDSIASYPGNCPCPYNAARNGSMCGGRSAYSRPGGYSPICYAHDVSKKMIADYRREH